MSLRELLQVVSPPLHPVEVGTRESWRSIEATLGLVLPFDLYDLCSTYGSGWFMGITIYNPFSPAYLETIEQDLTTYRLVKQAERSETFPFHLYPDKPGLLPCGSEENGGQLFWFVDGSTQFWPLVLMGSAFTWEKKELELTTFLAKSFKNEIECIWWDRNWQQEEFATINFRSEPMTS